MDPSNSPLRYPGGKGRLSGFIRQIFEDNELLDGHYVEPYAGGAGLALNLLFLDYASCIHLNDIDRSVFAFWHSVVNSPDALCKLIRDTPVTVDQWQKQKVIHRSPDKQSLLDLGFATFFLNRCNRSGILMGGIIGGQKQEGTWKIDARYNKSDLCRRIEKECGEWGCGCGDYSSRHPTIHSHKGERTTTHFISDLTTTLFLLDLLTTHSPST